MFRKPMKMRDLEFLGVPSYVVEKDEPTLLFFPTRKDSRKWAGWLADSLAVIAENLGWSKKGNKKEELGKVVPKRLAGRIKRRFSGENCKVKERGLQDDSQRLTANTSRISQLKTENLPPETRNPKPVIVLEIDQHRPDRIIFEGKEIGVTATEFSLIRFLAQHNGQVMSYEDIIKKLWGAETDAIYTRIIQHIYYFRKNILDAIGNNKTNKEKVKDIFKVVSGRGVMLSINVKQLKID